MTAEDGQVNSTPPPPAAAKRLAGKHDPDTDCCVEWNAEPKLSQSVALAHHRLTVDGRRARRHDRVIADGRQCVSGGGATDGAW